MAWELYIHHIDVQQGEATLIVAYETGAGTIRSMLIDGGRAFTAESVHNYVSTHIFGQAALDRIVTTHYDIDHSGGIATLLIADNRHWLQKTVADAAGAAAHAAANAGNNNGMLNRVSAGAAAAAAAAEGAYNDTNGGNYNGAAVTAGTAGRNGVDPNSTTNAAAALDGFVAGSNSAGHAANLNATLIPGFWKRCTVCEAAGIAAATAGGSAANRSTAAFNAIDPLLDSTSSTFTQFQTGGLYRTANVIDVGGGTVASPTKYARAVEGRWTMSSNYGVRAPSIDRVRTTPALGDEILWNTGAAPGTAAQAAPAGAPAVFVTAVNRMVRNAPGNALPIGGNASNNVSLGMVVRFNNFFYYTGGDLPYQGEDLVGTDVRANGLPDPQNPHNAFAVPNHVCAFKCGHHGSDTSTSQAFVNRLRARSAFISTGGNMFEHPDQAVINRVIAHNDMRYLYLTNLNWATPNVPASNGVNQWTAAGNKAFIAGDNNIFNFAPGRHRGDIEVRVNAAESLSATHPPTVIAANAVHHRFRVRYWEEDRPGGANFHVDTVDH